MKQAIKIDDDVRGVLNAATVDGTILRLNGQLDRGLYTRTNKALEALGGKWNRGKGGHVFATDPRAVIAAAAEEGKVAHPNPHDFFRTSREVAEMACERLAMGDVWKRTLEPSAGEGDLFAPLVEWHGRPRVGLLELVEINAARRSALCARGFGDHFVGNDFLTLRPDALRPFDRILMNPPFERGSDAKHITHALHFLAPGGRLVAIASAGLRGRGDKVTATLRSRIEAWGGVIEDLPEGSFKHAGTNVATVLLTFDKPRAA